MGSGDEAIKMNASQGDFSTVSLNINSSGYASFNSSSNLNIFFESPICKYRKIALVFIGIFIFVVGVAYISSSGVETPLKMVNTCQNQVLDGLKLG